MNCKPGDLAVITRGNNAGLFVTCIALVENNQDGNISFRNKSTGTNDKPVWKIDGPIEWKTMDGVPVQHAYVQDCRLMPIRLDELEADQSDYVIQELLSHV